MIPGSRQGAAEELDVRLFIKRDVPEIVVVVSGVASIYEVLETKFLQGTMIEVVLEMFKLSVRKYSRRVTDLVHIPSTQTGGQWNQCWWTV